MTKARTIYLAGPISVTDFEGATGWYEDARLMLDDSFEILRPMRGKEFLKDHPGPIGPEAHDHLLSRGRAVLCRDRDDVLRSDIVLMNLTGCAGEKSIGCSMEAAWAFDHGKILIVAAPEGCEHARHIMFGQAATYLVSTLEEACFVANAMLPQPGWAANDRHWQD